ncbi:dTMP kinase [bacterium]|nr:dTMP kinase [bacterium]
MLHKKNGYLIAIEGIDGTGKSTLASALARALEARGRAVVLSFEPTRGAHGRRIRELAVSGRSNPAEETELFINDRREHVANLIAPALADGKTVVLDRYYYSTMAYQGARGMDTAEIQKRNEEFAPRPDLLVILELPVEDALKRITEKRGSTPDHFEGAEYLSAVDKIFKSIHHPNVLRLDARKATEETVAEILNKIN